MPRWPRLTHKDRPLQMRAPACRPPPWCPRRKTRGCRRCVRPSPWPWGRGGGAVRDELEPVEREPPVVAARGDRELSVEGDRARSLDASVAPDASKASRSPLVPGDRGRALHAVLTRLDERQLVLLDAAVNLAV